MSLHFAALFALPDELKPFVPDYQYWLCDLSQYSDDEIRGEVTLRVALLLLKYILSDDLRQRLGHILGLLAALLEQKTGLEYIETILRYLSGGTEKINAAELKQVVTEAFIEGEKLMPTISEQWIEQGRIEGREEGREEGERRAELRLLRRFLHHRFDVPLDHFDEQLATLDLAALTQLSDAAFEVDTLAEFETILTELPPAPADNDNPDEA